MVRRNIVVVPLTAFLLGGLATAFSFIAYVKRIKDIGAKVNGYCVYPSSPSFGLGIAAALCLVAEQIVISAGTHCFCCCGSRCKPRCTYITSLLFFIASWIGFAIAFAGMILSSIMNNRSFLVNTYPGNDGDECKAENDALFLGAAFWCIICTVLGLISYAFWAWAEARSRKTHENLAGFAKPSHGIAMGQSQA
ncbi:unnamed protein product [Amaranthus hypochondriacus]